MDTRICLFSEMNEFGWTGTAFMHSIDEHHYHARW